MADKAKAAAPAEKKTTTKVSDAASAKTTTHTAAHSAKKGGVQVTVDIEKSAHSVSKKFLSMAAGARLTQRLNRWQFNTESKKVQNLAAALSPCQLRVGGSCAQSLLFTPNNSRDNLVHPDALDDYFYGFCSNWWERSYTVITPEESREHFVVNTDQWDTLNQFLQKVEWDLVWDLNSMVYKDGGWDPTNAALLFHYSAEKDYKIAGFLLGHEPNSQDLKYKTPDELVMDYRILKELLSEYPLYKESALIGPNVTQKGIPEFYEKFLKAGGKELVSQASFHHYAAPVKDASVDECVCVGMLDEFKGLVEKTTKITEEQFPELPVALTETGSFCGDNGADGISNRYCSGFLWLDKLGQSAKNGINQVFRASFWGAAHGILNHTNLDPNTDYYLCVLYKRLVEGAVFEVSSTPANPALRIYANAARTDSCYAYPEGSLVLYYVNVSEDAINVSLSQFGAKKVDLFILTSGDGELDSSNIKLNGTTLTMDGSELPSMEPEQHSGDVNVPGHSYGFIVVPDAYNSHTCKGVVRRSLS